jgi:hypothetical protein
LGTAGKEGLERGAKAVAERGGVFSEEETWDVPAKTPRNSSSLPS